MQTDPPRSFDVSSWNLEPHVREALELAVSLCEKDEAVDSRSLFRAIVRVSEKAPEGAFAFVAKMLEGESSYELPSEFAPVDLTSLELAGPLARSRV